MSAADSAFRIPHSAFVYQCRLPGFEGPLDLLLRLIERQQLDITAISLAAVADQFGVYLARLPARDPHILAEFATVASRLLLLKTRVLLPRQAAPAGGEAEEEDLVRQLQEYRRVKRAAELLAARERGGLRAFAPLAASRADGPAAMATVTLAPAQPADLLRAVHRRLAQLPAAPRLLALPPRISVGEMAARIVARLRASAEVRFGALIEGLSAAAAETGRGEVVTAFMAILELVRRRQATARQEAPFGDIVLSPVAGTDGVEYAADD